MKILVLGGTGFVGRHIVAAALGSGHEVTLFNRGSDRGVFPEAERRIGDRDGGLDTLEEGAWDAVVDVNGYVPRLVGDAARLLAGRVGRYAFVSTISVYADRTLPTTSEEAPLAELEDPATEVIDGSTYGPLKVACERVVEALYGASSLLIRPGVVVGPHDPTDRFTYWVRRTAEGGEVLAPEGPSAPTQWIDARDLAAWTVVALEGERSGPYNLVIPPGSVTFGSMLGAIDGVAGGGAEPVWVDGDFLVERDVRPFRDLPLWLHGPSVGLLRIDPSRAVADGLRPTPLERTVRDTLAWDRSRPQEPLGAGLTREREHELLEAWREHGG